MKDIELELRSVESQGAHEVGGAPQGVGAPCTLVDRVGPLMLILSLVFLLFPKHVSMDSQVIPRTFIYAQK